MEDPEIEFFPYIYVEPEDYRWRAQAGESSLVFVLPRSFVAEGLHATPVLGNLRLVLDYGKVIRVACQRALKSRGGIRVNDHIEITLQTQDLRIPAHCTALS
ncbi:MAG TPA: hypothetical protein VND94_05905 [Terriglobia bacterium]|nr:hypothetical protein [Terriglobia bacterium]